MDNPTKTKIFINYRREDVPGLAEDFYERLISIYGDVVFFDDESIKIGEPIPDRIIESLKNCEVFFSIIGLHWDNPENISRLQKEDDWVRHEIENAIQQEKLIITVWMFRSKMLDVNQLPYSLKAIPDLKRMDLPKEKKYWADRFRNLHEEIKTNISFSPKPSEQRLSPNIELHEEHQKLAYCLNHSNEIQSIKNARKNRQVLFSGSGKNEQELIYFAKRCSVSLEHTFIGILPGARVHQISWDFNELTPDEYQSKLCHQVAQAVPASFNSATVFPSLENLKAHFNTLESGQSYIFWAIRENGFSPLQTKQATQIWWDTWHSLLAEREKQNVIVFLFTEPGWFAWLNIMSRFRKRKDQHIGDFKGRIHKRHLDTWRLNFFNSYLAKPENKRQFDQDCLKNIFKEKYPKPSFLRQSLIFEKTVEFLESSLKEAYRPTHKSDNT